MTRHPDVERSMLHIGFAAIRPEKEARLRAWLVELGTRRDEVLETFRREGTRHEQVFIVPGPSGPLLVYATEVEDREAASAAYRSSVLPIDLEHRAVLDECLLERLRPTPVFECRDPADGR